MKNVLYILMMILYSVAMCSGATTIFQISDNLDSNGSGVVTGSTEVETTGLYRQSDGMTSSGTGPSGYNAINVGSEYGGGEIWRAVTTFDLSDIPVAPVGFAYQVTDISIKLEVSGGTNDNRPATEIDFYEGAFNSGSLPGSADATQLFNHGSGTFVTVSLGATSLGPTPVSSFSTFTLTMDAPDAVLDPGNNYYTFGSGIGPNIGFGGTSAVNLSPELIITVETIAIPEPSTAFLTAIFGLSALWIRRR